jgi:hypothetical protein
VSVERIGLYATIAAALCGLVAVLWRAVRRGVRIAGRIDEVVDDWQGTPARSGVPARPGLMERVATIEDRTCATAEQVGQLDGRLSAIEHELHPNSGTSLRDAVDRVDARTAHLAPDAEA